MNEKQSESGTASGSSPAVESFRQQCLGTPDPRSTAELVADLLASYEDSDADDSETDECKRDDPLGVLHCRGGEEEFRAGLALLASSEARQRAAGADILGQLGWGDRTFLEESVDALLNALRDPADEVVQSAIYALGHRRSERAIEPLLPFVDHPSEDFRYAVVHGLMRHDTPVVVEALIKLSRDIDRDVRDWATFALGSQLTSDSPALRAALHERISDVDAETRGEALVGLASRKDTSVAPMILRELEGEFHGNWAVEAAQLLGDPQFLPALRALLAQLDAADYAYFHERVQKAIAACEINKGASDDSRTP